MEFPELWEQIKAHEGQVFYTVRGKELRYTVQGNTIIPSRTRYQLSRADFEKAFQQMPLSGPGQISSLVRGSSYIYAILSRSAGTDPQFPIQNAKNAEDIPLRFLVSAIPRHILPDSSS